MENRYTIAKMGIKYTKGLWCKGYFGHHYNNALAIGNNLLNEFEENLSFTATRHTVKKCSRTFAASIRIKQFIISLTLYCSKLWRWCFLAIQIIFWFSIKFTIENLNKTFFYKGGYYRLSNTGKITNFFNRSSTDITQKRHNTPLFHS